MIELKELTREELSDINGGMILLTGGGGVSQMTWKILEQLGYMFNRPPHPTPDHIHRQTMGGLLWNTGMIGII